jgi:hypothetical protein
VVSVENASTCRSTALRKPGAGGAAPPRMALLLTSTLVPVLAPACYGRHGAPNLSLPFGRTRSLGSFAPTSGLHVDDSERRR